MENFYIRYFEETEEFWVCLDEGFFCQKVSGPWRDRILAEKAISIMNLRKP